MGKRKVTEQDIDSNPLLSLEGVKPGDEIEIEDTPEGSVETAPVETKAPGNEEKAAAIFAAMPHIHTIWFDEQGEWRFYETPGTTPIHKEDLADITID